MSPTWIVMAASPQGFDPDKVEPGLLGLSWFLALFAAVVLLGLSLRRHLRRLDAGRLGDRQGRTGTADDPPPPPPVASR
jgi:hypothetical protein